MSIFRFILEPSTVRLNLNDLGGFFLTGAPDLGTPEVESVWLSQMPYNGSVLSASRKGNALMTLPLALRAQSSFAAWKALVDALATELDRTSNVIEYQPEGASASYLIDTYRASVPSFVVDSPGEALHFNTVAFTLSIPRFPIMRGAGTHV